MHDVAAASLPVAIGLLALAATAWAIEFAQVSDATKRVARQYFEPLSTWCVIALGLHTLAVGAAGEAGVGSLAAPLGLAVAAVLLRSAGAPRNPIAAEREPQRASRPATPPPPAPDPAGTAAPAPARALWADATADEPARRNGLWSRA